MFAALSLKLDVELSGRSAEGVDVLVEATTFKGAEGLMEDATRRTELQGKRETARAALVVGVVAIAFTIALGGGRIHGERDRARSNVG